MTRFIKILFILAFPAVINAQGGGTDSLRRVLENTSVDSVRFMLNMHLYDLYEEKNLDSALYYSEQALSIATKHGKKLSRANALNAKGYQLLSIGKYGESLKCLMEAQEIAEDPENQGDYWKFISDPPPSKYRLAILSVTHHMYALLMSQTRNTEQEIFHYKEEIRISEKIERWTGLQLAYMNLGATYFRLNKLDSALEYSMKSLELSTQTGLQYYKGWVLCTLGQIYVAKNDKTAARHYYHESVQTSKEHENIGSLSWAYDRLTRYYLAEKNTDSSLYYAKATLESTNALGVISSLNPYLSDAYENLFAAYDLRNQFDSAYKYQGLALKTKDTLYENEIKNMAEFQNLSFSEQMRLQELEKEKVEYQGRVRTYSLLAGLGLFLVIAILLYRNNRQKHQANIILGRALSDLKSAQSQLIQSEKMASLGELTAGIAHEIQNPLNFVNNFSEVNAELIEEMNEEIDHGKWDSVKMIAKDIRENQEKISQHGKRADSIVKGMLQHSRSSNGVKEPVDINALADEYLRLAYHGLRAKDKTFSAAMKTDYDRSMGTVNIIPQDIGRVILNLITNAFYAVSEKKKSAPAGYEPVVAVSTRQLNGNVQIIVKDNGNGIPQKLKEKIFQPFFTTKPTGQGTGLGLSLSYDIIKAHGGEMSVDTREGEYAEFRISLPKL